MTRNRVTLALPAAVVLLSGCGVAAVTARTTTDSLVVAKPSATESAPTLGSLPRRVFAPVPAAAPAAPSTPAPAADVVTTVATGGVDEWLEIVSHTGKVVARTEINPTLGWMTAAGTGGA